MAEYNNILIPNVAEEVRIGSSFNHMIKVISETEAVVGKVVWDFRHVQFLHPFFLAPLAIYKNTAAKEIECVNMSLSIQSYLNSIFFDRLLHFENDKKDDVEKVMMAYADKTYIPLCSFAMTDSNKNVFGSVIQRIITTQTNIGKGGITAISYFISELLDNVYEHSKSKNGYVFSQYLSREGVINLCIADCGITIYNSYQNAGLHQKEIGGDEATALWLANEGYSTKNLPDAENRGYGISTSKRMLVEGLNGSFFMLSGSSFHRYERYHESYYVNLKDVFRWNGTIILLKIPVKVPLGFNYYDYLE